MAHLTRVWNIFTRTKNYRKRYSK